MSVATELQRIIDAKAGLKTAIEAKGVTVSSDALLDAYPALVDAIPSGGGEVEKKDVNFYDYDGTRVASFSGSELQALTALPDAPDHTSDFVPLTFDEWNWTLAELKAYNTSYPSAILSVGANYHTTDNRNHYIIYVPDNTVPYTAKFSNISGITDIDWGDGSTELSTTHSYQGKGFYDCSFSGGQTVNVFVRESPLSPLYAFISSSATTISFYGDWAVSLTRISLPNTITVVPQSISKTSLASIIFPRSITNWSYELGSSAPLFRAIIPGNLNTLDNSFNLKYVYQLKDILIPDGATSIPYAFCQLVNKSNQNLVIPTSVTTIGQSAFEGVGLSPIILPSTITSIGKWALTQTKVVIIYASTPPTIDSATFGASFIQKIYVPYSADHSVLTAYQNATNWSNYASKMEELPE